MGRNQIDGEMGRDKREKQNKKRMKMYYVHASTLQLKCTNKG